jgi:hypothetical protein
VNLSPCFYPWVLNRGDGHDGGGGGLREPYGTAEGWCGEVVNVRDVFVVGFERGCDRLEGVHSVADVQAEIKSQNETQLLSPPASPAPLPPHVHGVSHDLAPLDQDSDVEYHRSNLSTLTFHEPARSVNFSRPARDVWCLWIGLSARAPNLCHAPISRIHGPFPAVLVSESH